MIYILRKIATIFCVYLALFFINHLTFGLYFYHGTIAGGLGEWIRSFYYQLPLDISTACYAICVSVIFTTLEFATLSLAVATLHRWFIYFVIVLACIVCCADIAVYQEMSVKLHFKLLLYLKNPSEVVNSARWSLLVMGVVGILIQSAIGIMLVKKLVPTLPTNTMLDKQGAVISTAKRVRWSVSLFVLLVLLSVIGMRGGLQPIPINESDVYYSKNNWCNDASVNPSWTLLHSYIENKGAFYKNEYLFESRQAVDSLFSELYAKDSVHTTTSIISTQHPNVVLIILEGWSANLVGSLGGMQGVTPGFDSLANEGVLFTEAYASGRLSDQGIPAILSGFPAQPSTSILHHLNKYPNLPCINHELEASGYNTSFRFGGQLSYGNIKSYLYYNRFGSIKEQTDFPDLAPVGRLGIHDEAMFTSWLNEIDTMSQPFFTTLFTLSSHSPFDHPLRDTLHMGAEYQPYINSVHYSDWSLKNFMNKAKSAPWYKNTVFIISADHSHGSPQECAWESRCYRHIPIMICGGAVKKEWRGRRFVDLISQTDIAATLLAQLGLSSKRYPWSRNVFSSSYQPSVFYTFYNGCGYYKPDGYMVFDRRVGDKITASAGDTTLILQLQTTGKMLMQKLAQDFLDM